MAVASNSSSGGLGYCGNLACGHTSSPCPATLRIDTFTSNGLQSNGKIRYTATCSGTWSFPNGIVWASNAAFSNSMSMGGQSTFWTTAKGCNTACPPGNGNCCNCNGITYTTGTKTFTFELSPTTTSVTVYWTYHRNNLSCTYNIPESMRITKPSGVSLSCPSSLGGMATGSVSSWGGTGKGTFTFKTLNSSGSVIGTDSCTTTSTSCSVLMPGSYARNTRYSMTMTACNTANMCVSKSGCTLYSPPPCPSVSILSCVYNPSTKKCALHFSWSKASDAGLYTETISYEVTDNDGRSYASGILATVSDGSSETGDINLTNIETAVNVKVEVTCSSTAGSCVGSASVYSPVAGAAFIGFNWDELRRECTILGTAPGAKQTRISAGYAPNNYNIGTKVTPGEYGDLVVKDLNHGNGEILYLEAMPEATDNHKYIDEVAKISIPIPNPILGIWTPTCEAIAAGAERKYIVDIIEKKKDANSCTPRWKVGDRVVRIAPCNPAQTGHDALPQCNECGPGQDCGGSTPPPTTPRYTVTFDPQNGQTPTKAIVKEGNTVTPPLTDPTKEDCDFNGWYADGQTPDPCPTE